MTAHPLAIPITHDFVSDAIRLGDPDVCGTLAVYPLFGPAPALTSISVAPSGVEIRAHVGLPVRCTTPGLIALATMTPATLGRNAGVPNFIRTSGV